MMIQVYQPFYLAYPDPAALGSIATAIGRAYLPRLTSRQALRLLTKLIWPHTNRGRLAALHKAANSSEVGSRGMQAMPRAIRPSRALCLRARAQCVRRSATLISSASPNVPPGAKSAIGSNLDSALT